MFSFFRSLCPNCRCGSVCGTNWTCSQCRGIMTEAAKGLIKSGMDPKYKAGLILLGAGAILVDACYNPVPYQEILDLQAREAPAPYRNSEDPYNTECSICLNAFTPDDQVVHTTCKHTFHHSCVQGHRLEACPNCRTHLNPPLG